MSPKQNVVILFNSFDTGGAETQAVQLARLLKESGRYGVHLACLHRRGALLPEAESLALGEIAEFPIRGFRDRSMIVQLRRFARYLKEREIAIAHSQDFYMNVFGMLGASLARTRVRIAFWGWIGDEISGAHMLLQRLSFRLAHSIHANSERVREHLVRIGVPARKIAVVYNGLDLRRVTPPDGFRREDALRALGLPRDGRRFVTIVANMRDSPEHPLVKNHPMFLRAARRVREGFPEAAFVLAGEGELVAPTRDLAAELGLAADAFFIGRCDRVAELLAVSDVCALSSKAEGFSNAILEYMGAGCPVVVTDVGGAREAVVEGETGYLVPSGGDELMATRIISLLRNPVRAREMGALGRRRLEENYSDRAQLENTERLYDDLLARAPAPRRAEGVRGDSP